MTAACGTAYNRNTYRTHHRFHKKGSRRAERTYQIRKFFITVIFTIVIAFICGISFGSFLSKAETPSEQDQMRYKYYESITLDSGDSLWSVAKQAMDDHDMYGDYDSIDDYIADVCNINSIKDANSIHAGSHLIIPYFSGEYK